MSVTPTMPTSSKKVELLAPAGNFEKLEIAVHFGADAVYLGDKSFSLRSFADNFSVAEIKKAVTYARHHQVRVYVACNIFSRTVEADALAEYLRALGDIGPEAVIVADPGIFYMARTIIPHIPLHLSTQANTTSLQAVRFWEKMGIARINIARELSLAEIEAITRQSNVDIEAFVHGAMCMAYSGRCLLSAYLSGRDSNRGMCSHPCRWRYHVVEEQRPGQYLPVAGDDRGTYLFSSKDLCMVEHLDKMINAGIKSLKIEGRMKSIHYLAATVKVYREAIDTCYASPADYKARQSWREELAAINNRGFCTGFYFGNPDDGAINDNGSRTVNDRVFVAKVMEKTEDGVVGVQVRNKLFRGDSVEILTSTGPVKTDVVQTIIDETGQHVDFAQPNSLVRLGLSSAYQPNDLIRKITDE
ncbi:MAG: U32 family peptidase [Thermodesulfobacteriota bacterium]|nr:U32 family peptidase [Thermodesulfobacteriota bacterium]